MSNDAPDACAMQCSLRLSDYQIVHMACLWIKFSLRYYPIGHYNPLRMSQEDVIERSNRYFYGVLPTLISIVVFSFPIPMEFLAWRII